MRSADLLTPAEARADPAHRLWFAFADAAAMARQTQDPEDAAAARRAFNAFFLDFTAPSAGRANVPNRTAHVACALRSAPATTETAAGLP